MEKLKVAIIGVSGRGGYTSRLYTGFLTEIDNGSLDLTLYVRKNEPYIGNLKAEKVWSSYLYPFQIFKKVTMDKPQVVHIQHEFNMFGSLYTILVSPILYLLLKLTGVKIVSTVHTVIRPWEVNQQYVTEMISEKSRFFALPIKVLTILIYQPLRLSNSIIVHLPSQKEVLCKHYKIKENKIVVLPHGVDDPIQNVNEKVAMKWQDRLNHRKIVLYFGFIHPRKGIEYLVEAFRKFSIGEDDWVLLVAGGISKGHAKYLDKLKMIVNSGDLNSKVVFTGFLPVEDVHALYNLSEFIVLPYTHVVGNSAPASLAMQHGTPIIASDLSPFCEDLENGKEAILCPPRNPDAIVKAMSLLTNNPSLKNDISNNLRSKASKRSWAIIASAIYELYLKLAQDFFNKVQ